MSEKHTPGPWEATSRDHPEQGVYGWGFRIATMTGGELSRDIANARLIAAAPDMYEALKLCREYLAHSLGSTSEVNPYPAIDAALAKATIRADERAAIRALANPSPAAPVSPSGPGQSETQGG